MIFVTAASTVIRSLVVLLAVTFVGWRTADLSYHLLSLAGMSIDDKTIAFVMLAGASLIAALVGLAPVLLVRVIQHKEVTGFLGCSLAFWKRTWFVLRASLAAFTFAIFLLLVLPLLGADLRLRWVIALCATVVALALIVSRERSTTLLRRLVIFARPRESGRGTARIAPFGRRSAVIRAAKCKPKTFRYPPLPFRITLLFGAFLGVCAAANYLPRYLLARASSDIAIKMERVREDLLPPANGWWRDFVAITIFAIIKVYLLITLGICDWYNNDGAGYITLAENLKQWQTWVSVPDLQSAVIPLSLLRMPGYPLLILMMQVTTGDFWIAALISLQLFASVFATFVLYRTIWSFCCRWFVGVLGAAWFASSSIGRFELCILSDSFATSIFTILLCWIGLRVFRGRLLTPLAAASIAMAFPLLFLLREVNMLLALSLAPLVLAALPRTHRLGRLTGVYAPLALVFVMVGLWQQYRTGYFLVTTGGQGNPVEALALIDKISPVLDQKNPVDRAVRSVTADMAPFDVAQNSWSIAVKINELLAEQLNIRAPQLARLALSRYLSVWLEHPHEMLAHVVRNQTTIRTVGVSPVIYNDPRLSDRTRDFDSYASQQVVEWGLVNLPVLWLAVLIVAAPLRRTALMTFGLWVTSIVPVLFYSGMYLETRYVLASLGPMLLVLSLTMGTGVRVLSRSMPMRERHNLERRQQSVESLAGF